MESRQECQPGCNSPSLWEEASEKETAPVFLHSLIKDTEGKQVKESKSIKAITASDKQKTEGSKPYTGEKSHWRACASPGESGDI